MNPSEIKIVHAKTPDVWRKWLIKHHTSEQAVWLVFYNKSSSKTSISWSEAVDQALCFGWIDSKKIAVDSETSHQFFSKRKPHGTWSKINKEKVKRLTEQGLMTEAGQKCIDIAKKNGAWFILDEVEEAVFPPDLLQELKKNPDAARFLKGLSRSAIKMILHWLVLAKRPETRQKRLQEVIERANKGLRPAHQMR
jgi:uncharacterized protein YdeI (YjbR/CyaY-like superfamily)